VMLLTKTRVLASFVVAKLRIVALSPLRVMLRT
jgi:hypothetical protein